MDAPAAPGPSLPASPPPGPTPGPRPFSILPDDDERYLLPKPVANPQTRIRTYAPVILSVAMPQVHSAQPRPASRHFGAPAADRPRFPNGLPDRPKPRRRPQELEHHVPPVPLPEPERFPPSVEKEMVYFEGPAHGGEETGREMGSWLRIAWETVGEMYSRDHGRGVMGDEQELDPSSITYPTGWKWFLLLLSGAIPYIVVGDGMNAMRWQP